MKSSESKRKGNGNTPRIQARATPRSKLSIKRNIMYKKIWGLQKLEALHFPVPPYEVIDITSDCPQDLKAYLLKKIERVTVPLEPGDMIGVTIRISMPGELDKVAKHGGLHHTDKEMISRKIIEKYKEYGEKSKIIIQHTVDAKCSGAIIKERDHSILESISGDAPYLLEGKTNNYESWRFYPASQSWEKKKTYLLFDKEKNLLTENDLDIFALFIDKLPDLSYAEWSLSKIGKLFFYEYCQLKD
jgi:hypothetical protein